MLIVFGFICPGFKMSASVISLFLYLSIRIFSLCLDSLHAVQMQTEYAEIEDATEVSSWHQVRDAAALQCAYYPQSRSTPVAVISASTPISQR